MSRRFYRPPGGFYGGYPYGLTAASLPILLLGTAALASTVGYQSQYQRPIIVYNVYPQPYTNQIIPQYHYQY